MEVLVLTRIAVFVDYQKLYGGTRRGFGDPRSDPPTFGYVRTHRLGLLVVGRENREIMSLSACLAKVA